MRFVNICISHTLQQACLCLLLGLSAASQAQELFPRPSELQPAVDFWIKVYTQVDTNSGYIHDADDVSVIYETLQLTGNYRADKKLINTAKARHSATLKRLTAGRWQNLGVEEQRVLSLWGEAADSERLRKAAGQLRFQRGQSDRFAQGLARSGEWNTYIDAVLAEKGLPREIGILPHVESSFNPLAYSSAGAAGIWQFTRSTGRRYLQVDYVVDERMDPFAATVAAAQLLEHNYQLTGTWPLALTAYNHGAASMRRATKKLGTTDIATILRDYKGRSFGFASRNFYLSFLAALEVSSNPDHYFATINTALPIAYEEIELPDYLTVDSFARAFNTNLDVLKQHNRALLEPIWRGKKRVPQGFTMRVPSDHIIGTPTELLAAIPAEERFSEQTPDLFHTVVRGDTVSEISARYGHSSRDIAAMNGLNRRYQIRIGQVLRLPLEGSVIDRSATPTLALASAQDAAPDKVTKSDAPPAKPAADALARLVEQVNPVAAIPTGITAVSSADASHGADAMPGSEAMAGELTLSGEDGAELLADPSDYTVAEDLSIEVQASETLGHYAEWLDVRASQLRRLSGRRYGRPLVIGQRLKLDFSKVDPREFERRRIAYQSELQQNFFMAWQIRTVHKHVIARGESLWELTRQQYKVPLWLLRQYNPDLDPDRLHPGMVVVIPELVGA